MQIIYDTKTGHSKTIALQIANDAKDVNDVINTNISEKVILVTHTEGKGITPKMTLEFMEKHHAQVVALVLTGNYIKHPFEYGKAGIDMASKYTKPIIRIIQQEGREEDIQFIKEYIANLANFA